MLFDLRVARDSAPIISKTKSGINIDTKAVVTNAFGAQKLVTYWQHFVATLVNVTKPIAGFIHSIMSLSINSLSDPYI